VNSVILIGRLTADPQTHAGDKHESATFRLAVPRTASDGADFVDIVCFDKLAATCAEWLTKGREVAVVGKLRLSEWTSRNGERRSRLQVVADAVQSSAPRRRPATPAGPSPSRPTSPPSAPTVAKAAESVGGGRCTPAAPITSNRQPPPTALRTSRKEIVDMDQINLIQAKGRQGTSAVTACAVARRAAGEGRTVRLDGHDRDSLAAILGTTGDRPVIPAHPRRQQRQKCDVVVHDGPAPHGVSLLVTRPCNSPCAGQSTTAPRRTPPAVRSRRR